MECLICRNQIQNDIKFTSLLFTYQDEVYLCDECRDQFEPIHSKHCPSCYKSGIDGVCPDCLYWQKKGKEINHRALYTYNQAMKQYFSTYKFQGDYLLRKVFSHIMKKVLTDYKGYTIVPIPLSNESFQKRKFNQVTGFLDAAALTYCNLLKIGIEGKPTQSSKTREERLKTEQFFVIDSTQKIPEKVLLVDDIYTTGATMILAKDLLIESGVKIVKTFSLAR